MSFILLFETSEIFIKQLFEFTFGTVHEYEPEAAFIFDIIVFQLVPLFMEYSIFNFATFMLSHAMLQVVPAFKFSPPLGENKVIEEKLLRQLYL